MEKDREGVWDSGFERERSERQQESSAIGMFTSRLPTSLSTPTISLSQLRHDGEEYIECKVGIVENGLWMREMRSDVRIWHFAT